MKSNTQTLTKAGIAFGILSGLMLCPSGAAAQRGGSSGGRGGGVTTSSAARSSISTAPSTNTTSTASRSTAARNEVRNDAARSPRVETRTTTNPSNNWRDSLASTRPTTAEAARIRSLSRTEREAAARKIMQDSSKPMTQRAAEAARYRTIVYERTSPDGQKYRGRTEGYRLENRMAEHNRQLEKTQPGKKYDFKVVGAYNAGTGRIAEQSMIDRGRQQHGTLENRARGMSKENHARAILEQQKTHLEKERLNRQEHQRRQSALEHRYRERVKY